MEAAPPLVKKPSVVDVIDRPFFREAERLWAIAAPITFNIIYLYGVNSATQLFVDHLGNLHLSAAAAGLSVVSNISFGFLVPTPSGNH